MIYIIGFYVTMILYGILLEISSFRDYLDNFFDILKENHSFKFLKNTHNYISMLNLCYILSFTSLIGLIVLIALLTDYLIWQNKNKNLK